MKKRKNNEDSFLLGDEALIAAFGKEAIEDLKKNNYKGYCILRNNPSFMPSDIARDADDITQSIDND
jgi:hypothetical protein